MKGSISCQLSTLCLHCLLKHHLHSDSTLTWTNCRPFSKVEKGRFTWKKVDITVLSSLLENEVSTWNFMYNPLPLGKRCWLASCWCVIALNTVLTCGARQHQGCENAYSYWHSLQSHCSPNMWASITAKEKHVDSKVKMRVCNLEFPSQLIMLMLRLL